MLSFNVALCIDSADQTFTLIATALVHDYVHVRRSPVNTWHWPAACSHVLLVYAYAFRPLYPIFTIFVSPHASIIVNNALVSIPRVVDQEDCTFFCLLPTCSKFRRAVGHVDCRLFCGSLVVEEVWTNSGCEANIVSVLICGWNERCTFFSHVHKFQLYPSHHLPSQCQSQAQII